jgi:hypothetical protein
VGAQRYAMGSDGVERWNGNLGALMGYGDSVARTSDNNRLFASRDGTVTLRKRAVAIELGFVVFGHYHYSGG